MSRLGSGVLVALLGGAAWLVAHPALAQTTDAAAGALGSKTSLMLSLEHLGGYSYVAYEREGSPKSHGHEIGLFVPTPLGGRARLGAHYFVAPPLSLGVLTSYSDNDDFGTYVLIGARVGAAFPMSASTSFWLRGGIAYAQTTTDSGGSEAGYSALLPGGEALLALKPVEHLGFLVGGAFETAVGGKYERTVDSPGASSSDERDYKHMEVAFAMGVFVEL